MPGAEAAFAAALARTLAACGHEQLHAQIVQTLRGLVDCDQVTLYLRGRGGELRAVASAAGGRAAGRDGAPARPALRALAERCRSLLSRSDPASGALLAVPLLAEGKPLGALELRRHRAGTRFTAAECERAVAVASLSALSLLGAGRETALAEQARRDSLTGLYNHRHCHRLLEELLHREHASFAVVMLDLDDLKLVNDRYGHLRGDELLRAVGRALRRSIRGGDLAFRVGGDEFLLLLPNAGEAEALRLLERLEHELPQLPGLATLGLSHGIATAPADGESPDELLGCVDARLYRHKRQRKGGALPPEQDATEDYVLQTLPKAAIN